MKLVLIAPPYPLEEAPSPPLGLCYVAAACEAAGAEVRILDYIIRGYSEEKLVREMEAFEPDVLGITSVTMNFKAAAEILKAVKHHFPHVITMMGGPHVSFDILNSLSVCPALDLIVVGEGESTLMELLPVIRDRGKWAAIQGIAFRENDQIRVTPARPLIQDLDVLPMPSRHLLPMARYQSLGFPVSIITSRGCPNQCIFCLGRRMVGHKVRYRSPALIADEIEDILSYGIDFINVADDLFTASKSRVKAVCRELKKRNLVVTWGAFSRVNTVDAELLTIMKDAGCHAVSFGIESGNSEMLKRVRKGITLDQARAAVAACRKAGMRAHASFMAGLPGESAHSMTDTLNFQKELGIEFGYHFLAPFPGTTVREEIASYDLEILTDDWDRYNANHAIVRTSSLSPEDMEAFVREAYQGVQGEWEAIQKKYEDKTATEDEEMRVGGFYRMNLIFSMLNRDILENNPVFPGTGEEPFRAMCARVASLAASDDAFVAFTLQDLMNKGFIRREDHGGDTRFFWAHNTKKERLLPSGVEAETAVCPAG
ncbi:MAG: radical SAM protein [Pseudomonadota bacterium]